MAAYAALLSLAHISDMNRNHGKYLFSIDAKEKVRSIHEYVVFLLSFLEDFPEKANCWESKIRDVAYETEDIIDLYMWQNMQPNYIRENASSMELENLLKDVTEKIGSMAGAMMEERPTAISSSSRLVPAISASLSIPHAGSDELIGLEEDLMIIKEWLCGHSSKLQVVPIVGMSGIGKTTLTRSVYDDQLIIESFDIRAWVVVLQDYTPHRLRYIFLSLLESMKLLEERLSGEQIQESEIALRVYKNLKGRRYLVVMDDVWGTEVWDDLRNIFPDDNNGSRIMLTSRLLDVAAYPNSNSPLHQMQFMTDSQSWDLLKQKVFTNQNCPPRLEKVGKEIARKCLGLPLVDVLVAGFLSTVEKSVASWEEISRTVNTFVGEELDKILCLSYTHLPPHLRPCFLFIGGFPEDANIRASTLIKLWVAEGFMKHENMCGKSLEEEAEEYLEDLVKRNLVIVTSRKSNEKIKRCSLHDMIRDFCIKKAHEEKFLQVRLQNMINEPHYLSLNGSHVDYIWGLNIRTILGFQLQSFPSWPAFLERFGLLRVLDVVGDKYEELPSQVFELIHLRYLAIIYPKKIPSAISNLVNLQSLVIGASFKRTSYEDASDFCLPVEIWSMPQLRHLVFYDLCMLPGPPYGSNLPLQNIQTLFYVYNLVWNLEMVDMIPNVKRLGLICAINQEYNFHHLEHLLRLEKLQVNGFLDFSWRGQSPSFPRTLRKLTLEDGEFPWKQMSIIGSLPNLRVLKLRYACHGHIWETADEEFRQLEFLLIDSSEIEQWVTQGSHFPRLKRLALLTCVFLQKIPEGVGDIPTLELIETNDTFLLESAMKIKEDQESYGNYALQVQLSQ